MEKKRGEENNIDAIAAIWLVQLPKICLEGQVGCISPKRILVFWACVAADSWVEYFPTNRCAPAGTSCWAFQRPLKFFLKKTGAYSHWWLRGLLHPHKVTVQWSSSLHDINRPWVRIPPIPSAPSCSRQGKSSKLFFCYEEEEEGGRGEGERGAEEGEWQRDCERGLFKWFCRRWIVSMRLESSEWGDWSCG